MAPVGGATMSEVTDLEGWAVASSSAERPEDLGDVEWLDIAGPTTVADALRRHGRWSFADRRAFDEETWWYRCRLPPLSLDPGTKHVLRIGGLATLADVYIDGRHVLRSENMFHEHRIDLDDLLRERHAEGAARTTSISEWEILFRFAPLASALAEKRSRPRWKTKLVSHPQLRWIRTTLVGRMPGWSPPVPPVGPFRPVVLERFVGLRVNDVDLRPLVVGTAGVVQVSVRMSELASTAIARATVRVGDVAASLHVGRDGDVVTLRGDLTLPDVLLWWPHTHGAQNRYRAFIDVTLEAGGAHRIDLGHVAFRTIEIDAREHGFSLAVNGVPVFCRGACWTTTDVVTLTSTPAEYARVLGLVKSAGMNMVRMSGTLFYEADAFYETCDALGILVWQDFMFANMDYPIADERFRASVVREAKELLRRLQGRPCLAVLCGGSEVEQQAAMFGAARDLWRGSLEGEVLPEVCASIRPDVPYWPSSPSTRGLGPTPAYEGVTGGALPFHVGEGVAHYYGVGAYLRSFDDARRSRVRFASECLAFANVPEDDLFPLLLGDGEAPFVHAKWKERTSKDHGSGWDFEDVRDHYVRLLFDVDPMRVRYEDMDRYIALARVATGEAMSRVFAEWRRRDSTCRGGLVWFLQDLWPGAGWGILDSRGLPKSPWWFLKRVLQPIALFITDEGLNGLHLHVVNDTSEPIAATLRFSLHRDGEMRVAHGEASVSVSARSSMEIAGDGLLPAFTDSARAYRFGPPGHDLAVASLVKDDAIVAEAVHLLDFAHAPSCSGLEGRLVRGPGELLTATVRTKRFAHAVKITVLGYVADDNYFDLPPEGSRTVLLRPTGSIPRTLRAGELSALNLRVPVRLVVEDAVSPA